MHAIEPYFHWRNLYVASEDERSPFYGRVYNEFDFEHKIYNFLIHPQWDPIGSPTLFVKILFVDYEIGYCIIELIGEWNDAIENDIMTFKRDIIEEISYQGIDKYILIGENVLNFHSSDDCYYEEWTEDNENGWVALVNFHPHVKEELMDVGIDQYFILGGEMDELDWRTYLPAQLFNKVAAIVNNRLK
jgi:hypothetical protein